MLKVTSIGMDLGMLYGGHIFVLESTKVFFLLSFFFFLFSKYVFGLVFCEDYAVKFHKFLLFFKKKKKVKQNKLKVNQNYTKKKKKYIYI